MENKELKLGYMTTKELADWFDISYGYFRKQADKKYQELEEYCTFIKEYGKINIIEIYCPIYIKDKSLYQQVEDYTLQNWKTEEPESATRVGVAYYEDHPGLKVKEATIINYVRRARNKFWGNPKTLKPGENGGCHYVFVKMYKGKTSSSNRYELMTNEEYEKFLLIQTKYFSINPNKLAIALEKICNGSWSIEAAVEFIELLPENKNEKFFAFVNELAYELNCHWMVSATYAKDGVYYLEEKNEDGSTYLREITVEKPGAWSNDNQEQN